jgi:hypothetical protein
MSINLQNRILESIEEFFWYKCQGKQNYSQSIGENTIIYFNSVEESCDGFDPIVGFVNEITLSYTIEVSGDYNISIDSIPFNPENKTLKALAYYIDGLIDCNYFLTISYQKLVREFTTIIADYSALNQESEYGYEEEYPMDNYLAIMQIVALPEPTEAEEYLAMVSNPLAGLTEEKSWYRRQDPKKSKKIYRRTKSKNQGRKIKQAIFDFVDSLDYIEMDDCSAS